MGCCFGSFCDESYGSGTAHYGSDSQKNSQVAVNRKRAYSDEDSSIEVRRERARVAAEKRQLANQTRGVGHQSYLEVKQKRLEQEEKKAVSSGRANQTSALSWKVG